VEKNFTPSPGKINEFVVPGGQWVRVDTHIYQGYDLPFYYDSMLAKTHRMGRHKKRGHRKIKKEL